MLNIRFALRTLFKTPVVTGIAILSLALGLGANSAIFSMFDQLLLRSRAVPQEVEDTCVAHFRFESGATAVLSVSHAARESRDTLELFGQRGLRARARAQPGPHHDRHALGYA